jgi:Ca2+-binding EF-hand superfamily protein
VELEASFKVFDADGSGQITKEEMIKTMADIGEPLSADELKELLDKCDENGDGKINFKEFVTIATQAE